MVARIIFSVSLLLLLSSAPAVAQTVPLGNGTFTTVCNKSAVISSSALGFTELVAASAGKAIYVCAISIQSAGTVNVKIAQGTRTTTPCDTGESDLTGAYPEIANSGFTLSLSQAAYFSTAPGNELCISLSAAVGVFGFVSYGQS